MADKNKSSIHRIFAGTQKPSLQISETFSSCHFWASESWPRVWDWKSSYLDSNSGLSSAGSYLTSYVSVCLCVCNFKKIVYTREIEKRGILSPRVTFSLFPVAGRMILQPTIWAPNQERFSLKNNSRSKCLYFFKKLFRLRLLSGNGLLESRLHFKVL